MSQAELLTASGVVKKFGGFTALGGVDFVLHRNERVGLIGPNGSGKSTFVNCLSGVLGIDQGTIRFDGDAIETLPSWRRARAGIARSFQVPRPFKGSTVRENVEIPLMFAAGVHDRARLADQAQAILDLLGMGHLALKSPSRLSQVELRKLELGRAMAVRPRVLIADEAMAGLSDSEVDEIVDLLFAFNEQGIAIILIEHLMRAVTRFSERLVVLVAGAKIADGDPGEVMSHPEVVRAYLGE